MITKTKTYDSISLTDAKLHLRVDITTEDSLIQTCLEAAFAWCEQYIEKDIAETVCSCYLIDYSGTLIEIDEGNVMSITSIKDENNLDLAYYTSRVEYYDSSFVIELLQSSPEQDITVNFTTGFTSATLPKSIRQAILIKLADFYDVQRNSFNFNSMVKNDAVESLLNYHMAKRFKRIRN